MFMACLGYSVQGQPSQLSKTQPKKVKEKKTKKTTKKKGLGAGDTYIAQRGRVLA